ncbi:aldehyde reductase [Agromyces protaetiae]|uniref:Aldehyde reductase n=1 Tax=Agromyces protaetiae TaxID=2509455 RepID=A0A4P6F8X7_9MICO|nr:aldehyde reductase [Agromyces protaetiae]QAY72570.1 aldehyde reductase [Agromyces protaetiae]
MSDLVLVTGGTGYIAGWCIATLLDRGYRVRTTVRTLEKRDAVRAAVARAGTSVDVLDDRLEFVIADLLHDHGWSDALDGCSGVLHVASPLTATRDEDAVIRPAVDGTLRVLRAARDAGVRRVVATSSCGAVYYGHPERAEPFDETDWTVVGGGPMSAYVKSKALAEREAWDFVDREGGGLELAVVNPAGVFGPALSADATSSLGLVKRLLDGMPGIPNLWMGIVDVRDVADLHVRTLEAPDAAGERFIAWGDGPVSMSEIAEVLRSRLGGAAAKVPTRTLPDWLVRMVGRFSPEVGDLVPLLGQRRTATSAKAQRELGWHPRPWQDTIVDSATSLVEFGLVGPRDVP